MLTFATCPPNSFGRVYNACFTVNLLSYKPTLTATSSTTFSRRNTSIYNCKDKKGNKSIELTQGVARDKSCK